MSGIVIPKVWGKEIVLHNSNAYCAKRLIIMKGAVSSLHFHKTKMETFNLISGHIKLELDGEIKELLPGDYVTILPGQTHRFSGFEDSDIAEFSTLHKDSDVVRMENSYLSPILYGIDCDGTLANCGGIVEKRHLDGKDFVIISSRSRERSRQACKELGIEPFEIITCRVVSRSEEMKYVDRLFPIRRTIYCGDQESDKLEAERARWEYLSPRDFIDLNLGLEKEVEKWLGKS